MIKKIIFLVLPTVLLAFEAGAQVEGSVRDHSGNVIVGANVVWAGTNEGTVTNADGGFSLPKSAKTDKLVVSYLGFENDTISVSNDVGNIDVVLSEAELKEVEVVERKFGTTMSKGLLNQTNISNSELVRAACCNLGESFTTNPSVDVSYSDATTGARQIKLLGLSGSYVQMMFENIPDFRGAAVPYSLGYVPGTWMQSIQVSKGASSVKNGFESITGQINLEYKKPQDVESVTANVYGDSKSRIEAYAEANVHLSNRLSTGLLAHYENNFGNHDDNHDGFLDRPKTRQYNLMNRWMWKGDNYIFQGGISALNEKRNSGQTEHGGKGMEGEMYRIGIDTERYGAFAKNAYIFDSEHGSNVALMLSATMQLQDAGFGHKIYRVNQKNLYASLMYETNFDKKHSLSTGLSMVYDYYGQAVRMTNDLQAGMVRFRERESTPGAYAQYTFTLGDKFTAMAGLRGDWSDECGFFVTPRAHIKYAPTKIVSFRASAGKGYRSIHPLAEYNYLLASGRKMVIDKPEQEAAWNYGISSAFSIPLFGKMLNLNAEYYYTDFQRQSVVDYDTDPKVLHITNLDGKSYSHTFQIDASYPLFRGMTFTAAYRMSDVKTSYGGKLMERPLTSRYKGLITASYMTPLELWQFDVTFQMNGGGRMPTPYKTEDGSMSWSERFPAYGQLSAQITRWFRHWSIYVGGENLTGFRQKNPIVGAGDPWGESFDPTMVWGPVHGAMVYAGVRINFAKKNKVIPVNNL